MKTELTVKFIIEHNLSLPAWELGDNHDLVTHLADQAELYLIRLYRPLAIPIRVTPCPIHPGSGSADDPVEAMSPMFATTRLVGLDLLMHEDPV